MRRLIRAAAVGAALVSAGCGTFDLPDPVAPPPLARVRERAPSFRLEALSGLEGLEGLEVASESFRGRTLVVVAAGPRYARDIMPWLDTIRKRYGGPAQSASSVPPAADAGEPPEQGAATDGTGASGVKPAPAASRPSLPSVGPGGRYALIAAMEVPNLATFRAHEPWLPEEVDFHLAPVNSRRDRMYRTWAEIVRHEKKLRRRGSRRADYIARAAERFKDGLEAEEPGFRGALGLVGEGPHVVAVGPDGSLLALIDGPLSPERAKTLTDALDKVLGPSGK